MTRLAKLTLVVALVLLGGTANAQELREYIRRSAAYWSDLGKMPIIISQGQRIGDVQGISDQALLMRSSDCFPGLPAPNVTTPDLPAVLALDTGAGLLALGLEKVVGARLSAAGVVQVSVRYTDVKVETTYLSDLVATLAQSCEVLRPLLTQGQTVRYGGKVAQVISTIVTARREFILGSSTDAGASAALEDLRNLLKAKNVSIELLNPELATRLQMTGQRGVYVASRTPEVVAFQPTHIPSPWTLGRDQPAREPPFTPVDPNNPAHQDIMRNVSSLIEP